MSPSVRLGKMSVAMNARSRPHVTPHVVYAGTPVLPQDPKISPLGHPGTHNPYLPCRLPVPSANCVVSSFGCLAKQRRAHQKPPVAQP